MFITVEVLRAVLLKTPVFTNMKPCRFVCRYLYGNVYGAIPHKTRVFRFIICHDTRLNITANELSLWNRKYFRRQLHNCTPISKLLGSYDRASSAKYEERKKNQQDATIRCLLLTSISTCFGHHYAHLQENNDPVTAFGVLSWFCWMWLVAVVGRCLVGCEHCEGFCSTLSNRNLHSAHTLQDRAPRPLPTTSSRTRTIHQMQ
jgi:hypothetical protein